MNERRIVDAVIQLECQQLLNRIASLTDKRDWQALAECFTEDAVLTRPSDPDNPFRGRAEILASLQARPPRTTAHLNGGAVFTDIGTKVVHAVSRVWLLSGPFSTNAKPVTTDGDLLVGTFSDKLIRNEDQWLIAHRQGSIELKR